VVAVPLAAIGLGGVLALVLLQGEQPGEQASGRPVQATSRPTLVSVHRSAATTTVPTSSGASGPEAPVEDYEESPAAVRSGPRPTAAAPGAPTASSSTVEERRRGEPRTHRHRPTPSTSAPSAPSSPAPPPSTALPTTPDAPGTPADLPSSAPASPPVETAQPTPTDAITPTVVPEPAPPAEAPSTSNPTTSS
jgi:hypothetical protein